ncbi:NADH:flavin oxidoreductase/NADH oxidase family protein [Albimonas sp. CAU 1670]|uniref:NADH:flavin oxidoreductase/NADH oxidase family protein n=1 Tax=Albimonas sp. CAU 1670 TaxID=3032599 RepID=UPI0023D9E876|nr:NADH:flavin oxidoreductase/NADH oxidase family protein [Albimonas sp. CAU 1670]MDF2231679.1 NADH:flavin oxidoreductase/NADH oxidase family protein [Albimonas sp. CAU 1670]
MIETPLTLPCGTALPNRLANAAMTERIARPGNLVSDELVRLYARWAKGRPGLQITGNIQTTHDHLEAAGNVVAQAADLDGLRRLAAAAKAGGPAIAQISHAGRQTPKGVNPAPLAPSAVPLAGTGFDHGAPVAMTPAQIEAMVAGFAETAALCREAGFDGVQVHSAHGYLLSAFLNPLANRREDAWGGSEPARARALLAVVDAIRTACGPTFLLSVKLNSADFQEGGFTLSDCAQVARRLQDAGVDLLEISGGNYEQPAMILGGRRDDRRESTRAREAFFLDYAAELRGSVTLPMMVTGGFRTRAAMEAALAEGACDVIGLGRPMIADPDFPRRLIAGETEGQPDPEITPRSAQMAWWYEQIVRLSNGLEPDHEMTGEAAMTAFRAREAERLATYQAHWRAG